MAAQRLGAIYDQAVTHFRVWSPDATEVELCLHEHDPVLMQPSPNGYWLASVRAVPPGALYYYRVDGRGPYPDPASRFQPRGVHGPSAVIDPSAFLWTDHSWRGIDRSNLIFYELHIGTFTPQGTFAAAAAKLDYLKSLGITVVELMPVADFPGERNWGYDGVSLFAPAHCYGTPGDLRGFVDAAHRSGIAVFLDVVYNHFGPDGAYQGVFSRYYHSRKHRSPWGAAINYDGAGSEGVRDYVCENALHWIREYHMDGLRLDATQVISDDSPRHIVAALAGAVRAHLQDYKRQVHIIAEDSRNQAAILAPENAGGWELDGVWSDDFHHHVRHRLAGDTDGYYVDFDGSNESIARTIRDGWYFTGQHSVFRGAPRGTPPSHFDRDRFVFCIQNHDQIGNRAFGDRLHHQCDAAAWRAASVLLLMAPETPLLFMGQEWAASSPFQFFTDHHEELGRAVTIGRRSEFARFKAFSDPATRDRIPDPQAAETFLRSKLDWTEIDREPHAAVLNLYRDLLHLRGSLTLGPAHGFDTSEGAILFHRDPLLIVVQLGPGPASMDLPSGEWLPILATGDEIEADPPRIEFPGPGAVIFHSA
jgi:maltooligosyltrehalose trehalohydrolase